MTTRHHGTREPVSLMQCERCPDGSRCSVLPWLDSRPAPLNLPPVPPPRPRRKRRRWHGRLRLRPLCQHRLQLPRRRKRRLQHPPPPPQAGRTRRHSKRRTPAPRLAAPSPVPAVPGPETYWSTQSACSSTTLAGAALVVTPACSSGYTVASGAGTHLHGRPPRSPICRPPAGDLRSRWKREEAASMLTRSHLPPPPLLPAWAQRTQSSPPAAITPPGTRRSGQTDTFGGSSSGSRAAPALGAREPRWGGSPLNTWSADGGPRSDTRAARAERRIIPRWSRSCSGTARSR